MSEETTRTQRDVYVWKMSDDGWMELGKKFRPRHNDISYSMDCTSPFMDSRESTHAILGNTPCHIP